jgi:hypothetical protein
MAPLSSRLVWHVAFLLFVVIYAALLISQLGHGLASLDAHAIVKVTRQVIYQHHLEVSRPPGHPTTEFYIFPVTAWVLRHFFHAQFNEQIYLILQGAAAILGLSFFYGLLCQINAEPWKAFLASVCLGLSAQYFFNAVDGEEFVFAVLFLTLPLGLVLDNIDAPPISFRMLLAIGCFALATGCRPEAIFAGFILPFHALLHPEGSWKQALAILVAEAVAVAAIWSPVLYMGLHQPYTAGMGFRESVLGGGYRLVFQCFSLPVFVLICWVLFRSLLEWRKHAAEQFPENFVFIVSLITSIVFFAALFFHASKPSHVLFAVPFLLLLAVRRSNGLMIACAAATIIGCFVNVDIFKDRQLVMPYLVPGSYFQATRQKPFYKLEYLQQLRRHCGESRTVVIGDLWRWDIEYHIAHGTLRARKELFDNPDAMPMFVVESSSSRLDSETIGQQPMPQECVLLARDGALDPNLIKLLSSSGHLIRMDATLYRTLFARYDVTGPAPDKGQIGETPVELFSVSEH